MNGIVKIVVAVWAGCYIICLADLFFVSIMTLMKGSRCRWSKIVRTAIEELFMSPFAASLVVLLRLCEFTDWITKKARRNEDEDL